MSDTSKPRRRWLRYTLIGLLAVVVLAAGGLYAAYQNAPVSIAFAQGSGDLSNITLPEGFEITYFARDITGARSMKLSEDGTLFVGSRAPGVVYAIHNAADSTQAEEIITVASGLRSPNGVEIIDGDLYVAEIGRVLRYDDIKPT